MSINDLERRRDALIAKGQYLATRKQFWADRNFSNLVKRDQELIDQNNEELASIDRRIEYEFNFG